MPFRVLFPFTCIFLLTLGSVVPAEERHIQGANAKSPKNAQPPDDGSERRKVPLGAESPTDVQNNHAKRAQGIKFFEERILPQLTQHCSGCHSAKAKTLEGGLRLDTRAGLRAGGDSGAIIVPGKPSASPLIAALRFEDLEMPPEKKLPDAVIADFVKWVEMGAPDPRQDPIDPRTKHWSFQPIASVVPPAVKDRHWSRNSIDAFILARLERQQVEPSPAASPATRLRRVHLDLIGLPPTTAELKAFLADSASQAYDRVVSRLLASPQYAERWGRYWLDMARYADSDGYEGDRKRPYAWRWRDWVIGALDADMPFDQFTIEQLAGDLLPAATLEQQVATGFHRNTLINREGGVDGEEDRVKRTVDRTNTVGKVWLGLTLQCGQCHSHKYDPLTQREYYGFYAFFNSLSEPDIAAPTNSHLRDYESAKAKFQREHERFLEAIREYDSPALTKWEVAQSRQPTLWTRLRPEGLSTNKSSTLTLQPDLSVFASGNNVVPEKYTFVATTNLTGITGVRLEVLSDKRLPQRGPGRAGNGNFVLTSFQLSAAPLNDKEAIQNIAFRSARADFSQSGRNITSAIGNDPSDGWAIYPKTGKDHFAVFETQEDFGFQGGTELQFELDHALHDDHNIGKFRISVTKAPRPVSMNLAEGHLVEILKLPRAKRTGRQQWTLAVAAKVTDPKLTRLIDAEAEHAKLAPTHPRDVIKAQTVAELTAPRITAVHKRGDFLSKGVVVQPHVPAVLPQIKARDQQPDRLDLARWLVNSKNPLTARVMVNRVWQQYFGRGLVSSDSDFGTQGELPSHPELLDWLAARFRGDPPHPQDRSSNEPSPAWSLKALHRLIVTSATYQQSSAARPELLERDPYNTWLGRQNRLRVEAEVVRDLGLTVSGLLSAKIGGPSVHPPQPAGVSSLGFQNRVQWPTSTGDDRYRRGLYTFFQRTVPFPMLATFDASDSNLSCTRRDRSNTPLQALTLWNDPVFVEIAQALARRIVTESSEEPQQADRFSTRVRYAFRLCFSRDPSESEVNVLSELFSKQRRYYQTNAAAAKAVVGEGPVSKEISSEDLAAWTAVARTLINMDEFITRE